jgi:hypothetical protein
MSVSAADASRLLNLFYMKNNPEKLGTIDTIWYKLNGFGPNKMGEPLGTRAITIARESPPSIVQ